MVCSVCGGYCHGECTHHPWQRKVDYQIVADSTMDFGYQIGLAYGEYRLGAPVWRHGVRMDKEGGWKTIVDGLRLLADIIEKHYEPH